MRLIDVDKLLETLQDLEPHCDNKQYENGMLKMLRYYMPQIINDEPTAYDIDKVVAELEKLADENYKAYCIAFNSDDRAEYDAYTNAIEIVKRGGVFDDVCEWKSASDGEFIQNPHTKRLYSNEPSMQNVYCNTCGKKIKVVN